jgi:hypothetical protein
MRGRTVLLGLLTLLAACVACAGGDSGDSDEADPTPTTTPAPTTAASAATTTAPASTTTTAPATPTTTAGDQESAVIEAYLRYWEVFFTVNDPGQPESPLIDEVATGSAAQRLRDLAAQRLATNTAFRVPEPSAMSHSVTVVELAADTATIRDCFVDDSFEIDLVTGEVGQGELETNLISATLTFGDERWSLANPPNLLRQWPGAGTCEQ